MEEKKFIYQMPNNEQQGKYWCFTINNYDAETEADLQRLTEGESPRATYIIFGRETGESGTPHLQGYIEFAARQRFNQVRRLLGGRAHVERRRGTGLQAADYCKKDGSFVESGTISSPGPGKRTDLDRALDDIRAGATIQDLWTDHTAAMVRYSRGLLEARARLNPPTVSATYNLESFRVRLPAYDGRSLLVVGKSGIGKTQLALATYPKALFVSHIDQLKEFVPEEHDAIIFDDMSFKHLPRSAQIHLVDQDQPRAIHVRYGTAWIPARTPKVFLSNIEDIFDMQDSAIRRRIHLVRFPDLWDKLYTADDPFFPEDPPWPAPERS